MGSTDTTSSAATAAATDWILFSEAYMETNSCRVTSINSFVWIGLFHTRHRSRRGSVHLIVKEFAGKCRLPEADLVQSGAGQCWRLTLPINLCTDRIASADRSETTATQRDAVESIAVQRHAEGTSIDIAASVCINRITIVFAASFDLATIRPEPVRNRFGTGSDPVRIG
jgi:hypothetical protein